MDVLAKLKHVKEEAHLPEDDNDGDDYDFWQNLEIDKLKRYELRNYLAARDLRTDGKKKELVKRLRESIEADRLEEQAYMDELEAEFRRNADLEELGSIYAIGVNSSGQLGLGDTQPREQWRCVLPMRGLNVTKVVCGHDISYAITQDHDVYSWGGSGVGPMGMALTLEQISEGFWLEPTFVQPLKGEDIVDVSVGSGHGIAISDAGDCFAWGFASSGQLGLGHFEPSPTPVLVQKLQATKSVVGIAAGETHSLALTADNQVDNRGNRPTQPCCAVQCAAQCSALRRARCSSVLHRGWLSSPEQPRRACCRASRRRYCAPSHPRLVSAGPTRSLETCSPRTNARASLRAHACTRGAECLRSAKRVRISPDEGR